MVSTLNSVTRLSSTNSDVDNLCLIHRRTDEKTKRHLILQERGNSDMSPPHFLTENMKEELEKIRLQHNLRFIILHGSYAKREEHSESDFDIAVLGNQVIGFRELLDVHGSLDEVLEGVGIQDLDVKSLDRVDPLFRFLVVRDSILLAGDPHDYNEFKAYAFRDYVDSTDLRMLERRMVQSKQKMLSERYA
jgi:predicted nucleotidyltransferase